LNETVVHRPKPDQLGNVGRVQEEVGGAFFVNGGRQRDLAALFKH